MKKRILSLFMILALLLGVLPLFGFSEEEIATPIILVGGQNDTVEVWDDTVSALLASGYTEKELTIVLFGIAPENGEETVENKEEQSGIDVRYIDPASSVNDAVSELIDVSMEFYFAFRDSLPPDMISHFTGGIPAVTALYGRPDLFGKVVTLGTPFSGFPEEVAKNEYALHNDYVSGSTALFNLYAYAAESDEEFDGRVLNISGVGDGEIIPGDGILPAYALSLDEEDSGFLSYPAYRVAKKAKSQAEHPELMTAAYTEFQDENDPLFAFILDLLCDSGAFSGASLPEKDALLRLEGLSENDAALLIDKMNAIGGFYLRVLTESGGIIDFTNAHVIAEIETSNGSVITPVYDTPENRGDVFFSCGAGGATAKYGVIYVGGVPSGDFTLTFGVPEDPKYLTYTLDVPFESSLAGGAVSLFLARISAPYVPIYAIQLPEAGTDYNGSSLTLRFDEYSTGKYSFDDLSAEITVNGKTYTGVISETVYGIYHIDFVFDSEGEFALTAGNAYGSSLVIFFENDVLGRTPVVMGTIPFYQGTLVENMDEYLYESPFSTGFDGSWYHGENEETPLIVDDGLYFGIDATEEPYSFKPTETPQYTRIYTDMTFTFEEAEEDGEVFSVYDSDPENNEYPFWLFRIVKEDGRYLPSFFSWFPFDIFGTEYPGFDYFGQNVEVENEFTFLAGKEYTLHVELFFAEAKNGEQSTLVIYAKESNCNEFTKLFVGNIVDTNDQPTGKLSSLTFSGKVKIGEISASKLINKLDLSIARVGYTDYTDIHEAIAASVKKGKPVRLLHDASWTPTKDELNIPVEFINVNLLHLPENGYSASFSSDGNTVTLHGGIADKAVFKEKEYYEQPLYNSYGDKVTSLVGTDGPVLSGSVGTLLLPYSISDLNGAFEELTASELILKTTGLTDGSVLEISDLSKRSGEGFTVFCHKASNGSSTLYSELESAGLNVKNILSSPELALVSKNEEKNAVTLLGCIAANDLNYSGLTLTAEFLSGGESMRVFTQEFSSVSTTVTGYASVDLQTAVAAGLSYIDGYYLCGLTVNGVPEGAYEILLTLEGTIETEDGQISVTSGTTRILADV